VQDAVYPMKASGLLLGRIEPEQADHPVHVHE
jgi:hypothetical protein